MGDELRDTRFIGFGRAVIKRMLAHRLGGWIDFNEDDKHETKEYAAIIAQAAYSLAYYVLETAEIDLLGGIPGKLIMNIPDLPMLPEDEEHIQG